MKNILFVDIETVSQTDNYQNLSERLKTQWSRKSSFLKRNEEETDEDLYNDRAGIYAEFGKVIVIGIGFFAKNEEENTFRVKAIKGDDEKKLLLDFCDILNQFNAEELQLCGHNGKEFDFPYLCRRMLVNGIKLPYVLDTSGKKPWEVKHLDTMSMWKFGDYKHYTSLDLLASIFGIESSKVGIDGSQVGEVYYKENDLDKIADYCMRDVAVTAQLYLKLKSLDNFDFKNIIYLD
ncbi:MAG: 3'-5' exonuclease [Cyclobacteriaceae bacterium]|nr:3'-5' exonuclease [Cyclobacteriaceae bacterium]